MGESTLRAGLISDTHGLLRPQALAALRGVDVILHAGDIGSPEVLAALAEIAPVAAVRGNNDREAWARHIPDSRIVDLRGRNAYLLHDRAELERFPVPVACEIVVVGHSHRPLVERCDGVLYVNPGSAGPRRFRLPVCVAHLELDATRVEARIVELTV